MEYYIFDTKEEAFEKSSAIYDLYVSQPRSERTTLFAWYVFTNGSKFAMEYDSTGKFNAQGLLDGLTPETEQEVINQGYDLDTPVY
tara:strand:- start:269 stop:526 length:258 start_codon:yes stop_codon:yes gene_type:complete